MRLFWLGLKPREFTKSNVKVAHKKNDTGSFKKEQKTELSSDESDVEGVQITP